MLSKAFKLFSLHTHRLLCFFKVNYPVELLETFFFMGLNRYTVQFFTLSFFLGFRYIIATLPCAFDDWPFNTNYWLRIVTDYSQLEVSMHLYSALSKSNNLSIRLIAFKYNVNLISSKIKVFMKKAANSKNFRIWIIIPTFTKSSYVTLIDNIVDPFAFLNNQVTRHYRTVYLE